MQFPADKPCPRPGEMIVVKTKYGNFWRMKRAKGTPINESMSRTNAMLRKLSPAAARFVGELRPYMLNMMPGTINLRVKSCLQRSIKEKGELDYGYMEDLDFQPDNPIWQLMKHIQLIRSDGKDVVMKIAIPEGGAVKALNTFITGYRFGLIMVVGDPIEDKIMRTYDVSSPRYKTGIAVEEGCELRLVRPDEGEKWICIFSITSYQGKSLPANGRHYGMKVVGWDSMQMHIVRQAHYDIRQAHYDIRQAANDNAEEVEGVNDAIRQAHRDKNREVEGVNNGIRQAHPDKDRVVEGVNNRVEGVNERIRQAHPDKGRVFEGVNSVLEVLEAAVNRADPTARPDRREKVKAVALAILRAPGMNAPEIELKMALPIKSIQRHLKLLKDAGLIEYRGSAKTGGYFLCNQPANNKSINT